MHRKRVTCELHDSYFRSMTITQAIPKIAEVTHLDRQISEGIVEAWRRVHISAREFEDNIRPTNWIEGSKKKVSRCSRNLSRRHAVCVVSAIVYLHRRIQASPTNDPNSSPDCSYFTQASVKKINIYCYIWIPCCSLFDQFERNILTSVLRHEKGDTILQSPSYHTMLTPPLTFGTSCGVLDLN